MSERPTTLCEAFQRTATIDPDAVALRTPGDAQTLTWREYAAQVRQVAAGLSRQRPVASSYGWHRPALIQCRKPSLVGEIARSR